MKMLAVSAAPSVFVSLALVLVLAASGCEKSPSKTAFKLDEYNQWTRYVPSTNGTIHGKEIAVRIDRKSRGDRRPRDGDLELLHQILADLPAILTSAQAALSDYERDASGAYLAHVHNPHIWIPEDQEDPKEWAFVVERDDWPSFGWHIEFQGSKVIEVWSGN